jgi:carbon starvation protein
LPVWLLLCPRDYISSFLKIGTILVLMIGVVVANPMMQAPPINEYFALKGGPYFNGAIFPFVFICIMCGAISGFHALVSSGTTPKMVSSEKDLRMIGYGAMLMEGIVAVCALIVAAAMPAGDYWAINIDLSRMHEYSQTLAKMNANVDHLEELERQVGGESLRGRTGGAVTLAVGMATIMTDAMKKISSTIDIDSVIKYWFHFAIMFEALFILTTIDTGTRIARFLLQEVLGNVFPKFAKMDWWPGVILSTALVTLGWGSLIWSSSIDTIWPMFGIANQLLAGIALCVVTTWIFQNGRGRYAFVTIIPLVFIVITTFTAAAQLVSYRFWPLFLLGREKNDSQKMLQGGMCCTAIVFLIFCFVFILASSIAKAVRSDSSFDVSAALKRIFSRRRTSPALRLAASLAISGPVIPPVNFTSLPRSSERRSAIGARDNSGFASPFGRPRCAAITSDAPFSRRALIVGSDARILPSSVMTPPLSGTLRSQRRKTRLPCTSRSPNEIIKLEALSYIANEIYETV